MILMILLMNYHFKKDVQIYGKEDSGVCEV